MLVSGDLVEEQVDLEVEDLDQMIATVDRNGDGRISYSEFRFLFAI